MTFLLPPGIKGLIKDKIVDVLIVIPPERGTFSYLLLLSVQNIKKPKLFYFEMKPC